MTEPTVSDPSSGSDAFLIAEYQHFADSFWRTEELGEKRINFLISVLTAAVAGLGVLATSDSGFTDVQVKWVSFSTTIALLFLGLFTLLRMLRRNNVADQYKRAMDHVRETVCDRYALKGYAPLNGLPRQLFSGGLAQTAALLNSMIAAAATAIGLIFVAAPALWALSAGIVFVSSLAAQFAYIRHRHGRG